MASLPTGLTECAGARSLAPTALLVLTSAQSDAPQASVLVDQFALEPVADGAALLKAKAGHAAGAGVNLDG
ncbi:hypothetical protein ACVWZK_004185 [Bradyrhizobium sp. GM0.4]